MDLFREENNNMTSVKIVVFVPLTHTNNIRAVAGKAGAGVIGNYSYCSFSSRGKGRFKPNEKAKPHIGNINQLEEVEEERIEFTCAKEKAKRVIDAIKKAHPYEEIALDIYALLTEKDLNK